MKVEQLLITPKMAKEYLENNTHNRRVKMPVVNRYAELF